MVVGELFSRLASAEVKVESLDTNCFHCVCSSKIRFLGTSKDENLRSRLFGVCGAYFILKSPKRLNTSEYTTEFLFDCSTLDIFISRLQEVLAGKWVESPSSSVSIHNGQDNITVGTFSRDLGMAISIENKRRIVIDGSHFDSLAIVLSLESGKGLLDAFRRARELLNQQEALAS
jgi:hypothetical protein